jgi:hypothetical protein
VPEPPARSAAVLTPPPGLTDDGEREWFVPQAATNGPGSGRRALRVGDHLAPDHPLVTAWPDRFAPSAEPIDCWPVSVPSEEARRRQQAEQTRLASRPARKVTPTCARCGAEHPGSVIMTGQPTVLARLNALSGLDDGDPESRAERWRIEQEFRDAARAHADQQRQLTKLEAAFRASHQQCPDGTPELPEVKVPEELGIYYRTGRIDGRGQISVPSIPSPNGG